MMPSSRVLEFYYFIVIFDNRTSYSILEAVVRLTEGTRMAYSLTVTVLIITGSVGTSW